MRHQLLSLCLLITLTFLPGTLTAEPSLDQTAPASTPETEKKKEDVTHIAETQTSARELLENEKKGEELLRERENADPESIEAGRTPLATILALSSAFEKQDYERAGEFLDMRFLPEGVEKYAPQKLMRALAHMMSQQVILDYSALSDDPEGHLDDNLPAYRDLLGVLTLSEGEVPIYLQQVPDGNDGKTWKISNSSVKRIPEMWKELGFHPLAAYLFGVLPDFTYMGLFNWQVLGIILAPLIALPAAILISWLANRLAQLIPNEFPHGIERFFRRSFRLFLFIIITLMLVDELGLTLRLRVFLHSSGLNYLAYTALVLGIISLVRDYNIQRLNRSGQQNFAALLRPLSTILKVIVLIIVGLIWADTVGYNMSTVLAGLGVGSVAVALAAQKTLENLIGAITLYAARPVKPGDLCRFGSTVGTVEEIGLRSTTLRTLDRTLVSIPNSVFSAADIENYSQRDRIRFFRNVRVVAQSADQIRVILAGVRQTLYAHPMVYPDTVSVRLDDIGDVAAQIRIDAGIRTTDFQEFLATAEDLNLRFVELALNSGAALAGPGQLRIVRSETSAEGQNQHVEDMLALWREQDSQPFPNFTKEQIAEMGDTIAYPSGGRGKL